MKRIAMADLDKVLQARETSALVPASGRRLTDSEIDQLEMLMDQTKRNYFAQEIPPETAEMWAPMWAALAVKHGIEALRKALQDHMAASRFFPLPAELRERLEARSASDASRAAALKHMNDLAHWKTVCERERREELEGVA